MAKNFSAFIHIYYMWYGLSSVTACCSEENHILDLLGDKLKDRFSHYAAIIPVFTIKLHPLGPPACSISLFTLQRV